MDWSMLSTKNKRALFVLVLVIAIQALALVYLFFHREQSDTSQTNSNAMTQQWQRLARQAMEAKQHRQAIYFYEKILQNGGLQEEEQQQIQQTLLQLYKQLDLPQQQPQAVVNANAMPNLYNLAEQAFVEQEYKRAKQLYYTLLLRVDKNEEHQKLAARLQMRIFLCNCLQSLELPDQSDPLIQQAVSIITRQRAGQDEQKEK